MGDIDANLLYEREDQLQRLQAAVAEATDGNGSVVLVTGEAGIGKSSLVRAFVEGVTAPNRVYLGRCDDLFAPAARGALRDALAGSGTKLEQVLTGGSAGDVLAELMSELDRSVVTVLILEDVHWADDATLDVLRYLVRRLGSMRAVLVLTYRDEVVTGRHPLRRLLYATAVARVHRVALQPLSVDAIRDLAQGSEWSPSDLMELTDGNPFFVIEALAERDRVPATVVDAVLARMHGLSPAGAAAVEQLSVLPAKVAVSFAETLIPDHEALSEAEQQGIITVDGTELGFRHEITRRAVERSIPGSRRTRLNRIVMEQLLRAASPQLSQVVHHAVNAGDVDAMLRYGPKLARLATNIGSHREALTTLRAVLPYAGRLEPGERADLYDECAWELLIANRLSDAVELGQEAVNCRVQASDPERLGEVLLRQARRLSVVGDLRGAAAAVERAAAVTQSLESEKMKVAVEVHRGMLGAFDGRFAEAIAILAPAIEAAERTEQQRWVTLALCATGLARCLAGDAAGVVEIEQGIEVASSAGDHEFAVRSQLSLASVLYLQLSWGRLRECLLSASDAATEHGYWSLAYYIEIDRARLDLRQGKWDSAEQRVRRLLESFDDPQLLSTSCYPVLGRLLARRGSMEAEPLLAAAWERMTLVPAVTTFADVCTAYAEWAWLAGRQDVLVEIRDKVVATNLGDGPAFSEFHRYLGRAGLEPHQGDWRTSAAQWEGLGDPYEQALELAESGEREPMLVALSILESLDARAPASLVRRRLRGLGIRGVPIRSTFKAGSTVGLTTRQLEVLGLVTEGLTNAEVADRLVLSVRTVDHHVAAILTKLGISSRREAIAAARALGIVVDGN
ncbi:ATP-binding protein [Kribbella sp. NPDC055071]